LLLFFRLHKILSRFFHFYAIIPLKKPFFSKKIPKFALKLFTTSTKARDTKHIINTKKKHTKKEFFDL